MLHIYCGDGKGKTTACVGMAVRAAGSGLRVLFAQFLKARMTGELSVLGSIANITVMRAPASEKFTYQMTEEELDSTARANSDFLKEVFEKARKEDYDVLILDEGITAASADVLDEDELRSYVEAFDKDRELVLTGRVPFQWMVEDADYVTDMEKIKHLFDTGVQARKGIEF